MRLPLSLSFDTSLSLSLSFFRGDYFVLYKIARFANLRCCANTHELRYRTHQINRIVYVWFNVDSLLLLLLLLLSFLFLATDSRQNASVFLVQAIKRVFPVWWNYLIILKQTFHLGEWIERKTAFGARASTAPPVNYKFQRPFICSRSKKWRKQTQLSCFISVHYYILVWFCFRFIWLQQ